jgi:hypothetical protein
MNVNLNVGGFIGALLGAGIALVAVFGMMGDDSDYRRGMGKLVLLGVIGGALAGNYLWGRIRGQSDQDSA